jgi:hypothetical protein
MIAFTVVCDAPLGSVFDFARRNRARALPSWLLVVGGLLGWGLPLLLGLLAVLALHACLLGLLGLLVVLLGPFCFHCFKILRSSWFLLWYQHFWALPCEVSRTASCLLWGLVIPRPHISMP